MTQISISSPTGAALNAYVAQPDGPVKGVIQINHGLAEHAGRYGPFMAALAQAGYASIAHDHRGHGHTTALDAPMGQFAAKNGIARVMEDVGAVHDEVRQRWPDLPVVVFGHSMGGLIALNFAMTCPDRMAALAVWSANAAPGPLGWVARRLVGLEGLFGSRSAPSRLLPALSFAAWDKAIGERGTGFDWLSRDPKVVDAYVADPLCGWDASISLWADVLAMAHAGEKRGRLAKLPARLPIHILGGAEDPATEGGKACDALAGRLRARGMANITAQVLAQTRHETLNEPHGGEAIADLIGWIDDALVL